MMNKDNETQKKERGELNRASRKTMEKPGMHRTGEWSGRKNRGSEEERREWRYEVGGEQMIS